MPCPNEVYIKHPLAHDVHVSLKWIEKEKLIIQYWKYIPYESYNQLKDIIVVYQVYHDLTI